MTPEISILRIEERLVAVKLSASAASKKAGLSVDFIRNIKNGKSRGGTAPNLAALAIVLECSTDYLLGLSDYANDNDINERPEGFPLISWVQAGGMAEIIDNFQPGDADEWIDFPAKHSKVIALRVRGNSMNRISPEGSIIIVDLLQREMTPNRLYVVKMGDDATFKRYRDNPPRLEPDSTEAHDTIFLNGAEAQPLGRVIRTMMDFD